MWNDGTFWVEIKGETGVASAGQSAQAIQKKTRGVRVVRTVQKEIGA